MSDAAFARSATFRDVDRFVAALNASGGSVIPMASGASWEARLDLVGAGGFRLYRAALPPQIRRGAVAHNDMLMSSRTAPGSLLHQGHAFMPGEIVVMGRGTPIETSFRAPGVWTGVEFEPGWLARLGEGWALRTPGEGRHAILDLGLARQAATMAAIERGIAAATGDPALPGSPAAMAGLRESMEVAVARALAGPVAWREVARTTARNLRIVRAADERLRAASTAMPTIGDLAGSLAVSPRTLHRAFVAVHGCTPLTYVKRWRLMQVRAALRERPGSILVKTAALDHGFWHLGHFARAYRAMFGEHPRDTRRTAN